MASDADFDDFLARRTPKHVNPCYRCGSSSIWSCQLCRRHVCARHAWTRWGFYKGSSPVYTVRCGRCVLISYLPALLIFGVPALVLILKLILSAVLGR
jgi:hypothetical protein